MNNNSYAFHKVFQQFVYIAGMKDRTAEFNPNGRLFTVLLRDVDYFIAKRSELQPLEEIAGMKDPVSGRCAHKDAFIWERHVKWTPVMEMPVLEMQYKPGDHVMLTHHKNYKARIVSGRANSYSQVEYTVAYYKTTQSEGVRNFRIPRDNNTQINEEDLRLLDTPAPKLALNPETVRTFKDKVRRNMLVGLHQKSWRLSGTYAPYVKGRMDDLKTSGNMLSIVMAEAKNGKVDYLSNNLREVFRALVDSVRYPKDLLRKMINECSDVDEYLTICPNCEAIEHYDDLRYSADSDTSFCRNCEDNFQYSSCMEDWISSDIVDVYDTEAAYFNRNRDDVATRYYIDNRSDDYEMYNGSALNVDILEEVSSNDESNGTGLAGYHDSARRWREVWTDKSYVPLGVELEVYAQPRKSAVMAVARACQGEVYLERDGSLDRDYGFEVITQPFGKTEWATFGHKLLNTLKDKGAVAWSEPAGKGYGIHINISRKYLSALQETRMFMFLVANENRDFNRAIAQRSKIYSADVSMGETGKQYQKIRHMGGLSSNYVGQDSNGNDKYRRTLVGRGKYAPIRLHDDRMEIRVFQSTLNTLSFYKDLEFTWALVEWTSTKASTGTSWLHVDFLKWLVARPHAEKDYPNLLAYLRKKTFTLSDGDEDEDDGEYPDSVDSTWEDLIPKPNRSSIAVDVIRKTHDEVTQFVVPVVAVPVAKVYDYALAA